MDAEDEEMLPEQKPAVSLVAAREAAATLAQFMTENPDEFGRDVEFMFERKVSAPMSKMLIGRMKSRVQSTVHRFFSS